MFGHDHDDDKPKDEETHDGQAVATRTDHVVEPIDHSANNDTGTDSGWQHPGTPLKDDNDNAADNFTAEHAADEAGAAPNEHADPTPAPAFDSPSPQPDVDDSSNDLIDIKQEALGKLSPLIGHLDQSPDEKFRTLMMMIQASDDQGLVKQAYETALEITDEKARAQALLDIVNEINYFTQNPAKSE